MKLSLIAAIILSLLMAFFAVQNSQQTHVTFLGWYFDGPLVIVLLISFAVGALSALLIMLPGSLQKSIEISKLKSQLSKCSHKIESLEKISESRAQNPIKEAAHENNREV